MKTRVIITAAIGFVTLGACGGDGRSDSGTDAQVGLDGGIADVPMDTRDSGNADAPTDAPIDVPVDGAPPLSGDEFIVQSSAMTDYEGLTVYVRFDHNITPDGGSSTMSAVVTAGAFEVRWPGGFDRDSFGANVFLFVDVDADRTCTAADSTWSFFANNDMPGGDGGTPVSVDFDPDPSGTTVALATVDCASAGL